MTRDVWTGLVMLGAAVAYWFGADGIRISALDDLVGASGMPKALAWALGGLAVLLIVRSVLLERRTVRPAEADIAPEAAPVPVDPEAGNVGPHFRAAGMIGIGAAYLLLVPVLGYALGIVGLLLAVALYNGGGLSLKTALVAVLGGVFFYLLFVRFLGIPLPAGVWPGLIGGP